MHLARILTVTAGVVLLLSSCQQKPTGTPYRLSIAGCPTCYAVLENAQPPFNTLDSAQLHNGRLLLNGTVRA
jgi:hypothetical protein